MRIFSRFFLPWIFYFAIKVSETIPTWIFCNDTFFHLLAFSLFFLYLATDHLIRLPSLPQEMEDGLSPTHHKSSIGCSLVYLLIQYKSFTSSSSCRQETMFYVWATRYWSKLPIARGRKPTTTSAARITSVDKPECKSRIWPPPW